MKLNYWPIDYQFLPCVYKSDFSFIWSFWCNLAVLQNIFKIDPRLSCIFFTKFKQSLYPLSILLTHIRSGLSLNLVLEQRWHTELTSQLNYSLIVFIKLFSAMRRASQMLLLCSPNFLHVSITQKTHDNHESLNYEIIKVLYHFTLWRRGIRVGPRPDTVTIWWFFKS